MKDDEFQTKVLTGVEALKTDQEKLAGEFDAQKTKTEQLLSNYDQLHKDTKSAMEELTKVKNEFNSLTEVTNSIRKLQAQLQRESVMAFGDPIQRILRQPAKTKAIDHIVRCVMLRKPCDERILEDAGINTKAGAIVSTGTPGSKYVAGDLATEIYDVLATYGVWNTFGVRQVGTKTTTFPVATARPVAAWITTEGGQLSADTTKDATSVDCTLVFMGVLLYASMTMLDDSEFDLSGMVLNDFAQACSYRLDWSCLAADGTADATDGGMTGVFSGGTAATAANGNTTTETTDFEDWQRCLTTIASGLLRRPLRWWINPQIVARSLAVRDNSGRPIFLTSIEAPSAGAIGSILGYPVILADAAPSTNSASAVIAVLGDPEGQVVGIRRGFEFAESDQFAFDYLRRYYRGIMRAGTIIRAATAFAKLTLAAA